MYYVCEHFIVDLPQDYNATDKVWMTELTPNSCCICWYKLFFNSDWVRINIAIGTIGLTKVKKQTINSTNILQSWLSTSVEIDCQNTDFQKKKVRIKMIHTN